jgi:hypothetical protein
MPFVARLVRKARITAQALMRHIAPCNVAAPGEASILTVHHGRVWAGDSIPENQAILWHEDCELIDPILIDGGLTAHQANVLEGVLPGNLSLSASNDTEHALIALGLLVRCSAKLADQGHVVGLPK